MEKEFIFPLNYKEKEKFLGIVEYKVLVAIAVIGVITFFTLKYLELELSYKIVIFVVITGFFAVLILVGVNGENMLDFSYFMFKFLIRERVYVYRKTEEREKKRICESRLKRGCL